MRWVFGGTLFLALTLTGCATFFPSAAQLKALTDSDRSFCVSIIVPGMGTGRISGTGIKNGTVKCTQDEMSVESKIAPAK